MPYPVWTADLANLLSPEIVEKVGRTLDAGLVCGLHAFYAGAVGRNLARLRISIPTCARSNRAGRETG